MVNRLFFLLFLFIFSSLASAQKNTSREETLSAKQLITGLSVPWDMELIDEDHIIFTELAGTISLLDLKSMKVKELKKIKDVANELQTGLMGMALHPVFEINPQIFIAYTYYKKDELFLKLAQYKYKKGKLKFVKNIIENIPAAPTNVGGRVMTTDDGYLYLTVGEMEDSAAAQDTMSYKGKVLRFNADGTIPMTNPIKNSPIYALGLRNPQGLTQHNGKVYTSEHGTLSDDELNLIEPLSNYGWPQSIGHSGDTASGVQPLKSWTPTIAPCGIAAYKGDQFPFLKNNILIANLVDQSLRSVTLSANGESVINETIYLEEEIGRIRDVLVTEQGRVFVCSSNTDSYGINPEGKDGIYELEAITKTEDASYSLEEADTYLQLENTKLEIRVLTENLVHPWDMTWGPEGWIWITEAGGFIKKLNPKTQEIKLMHQFADVHETKNNPGIYSLAFHPDFKNQPYFFVHYQTEHEVTKLIRFVYDPSTEKLSDRNDIIPHIIGNESHNGSRIIFTEDHKIMFSVGDAYTTDRAQDTSLLNGSILRLNIDGSVPDDNPFPGNLIWSYGHRNPQGMAYTATGNLYSVEHGPANDDELNRIVKGGNYGWPEIKGKANLRSEKRKSKRASYIQPLISWTPTVAPNGMIYYNHDAIPEWKNSLLVTFLKKGKGKIGQRVGVYHLDKWGKITGQFEDIFVKKYGRLRAITQSPDGRIFIATSNNEKSGNGKKSIRPNDDRVLELRAVSN